MTGSNNTPLGARKPPSASGGDRAGDEEEWVTPVGGLAARRAAAEAAKAAAKAEKKAAKAARKAAKAVDPALRESRKQRFGATATPADSSTASGGSPFAGALVYGAPARRRQRSASEWEAMVVKGTCTVLEKRYFRLIEVRGRGGGGRAASAGMASKCAGTHSLHCRHPAPRILIPLSHPS